HPRDVVIDRAGYLLLAPHVQQDEVALTYKRGVFRARLIMRIAAVGVHGDNGTVVGHQAFALKLLQEPLVDLVLRGATIAHAAADFLEPGLSDGINRLPRFEVAADLV